MGLSLPGAEPERSPEFYADLLRSATLLRRLAETKLNVDGQDVPLSSAYSRGKGNSQEDKVVARLRKAVNVSVASRTGVVRVAVSGPSPALAIAVNQRLLDLLNEFNNETRRSQASAERRFAGERLDEVRAELRQAEDRLLTFLTNNRAYANSPLLTFEHERLAREVSYQHGLYETLAQAFERAKLEEVRDLPVITTVEPPAESSEDASGRALGQIILATLGGAVLALAWAFSSEYFTGMRSVNQPAVADLTRHMQRLAFELRHPVRAVRDSLISRRDDASNE
jgi:uncharacterized protein involved in exopolysaccharide biosynthesis